MMGERVVIDLAEAAAACLRDLLPVAARARVELVHKIPVDLPLVMTQPRALRCMLDVLMLNGIEMTPAGGTVTVTAGGHPPRVWIGVIDSGDGITHDEAAWLLRPAAARPHVSLPAGRAARRFEIARAVMELHGGSFEIHSLKGRGTTVMCCFSARELTAGPPAALSGAAD
jgi:signal transduction histidine kinase